MKKLKVAVVVLLSFSIILLFFVNGSLSKLLSVAFNYPNYLIITQDKYYDSLKLQEFVSWKTSQGFNVELVNLSHVYSIIPPFDNNVNFLKIQNLEDIYFSPSESIAKVYVLWYDEGYYRTYGYFNSYEQKFVAVSSPDSPRNVCLFISATGEGKIYLTYDGGKKLTVNYPNVPKDYINWGKRYVTVDGNIYRLKTDADRVLEFIKTKVNVEYVLLVGNIPSYEFRFLSTSNNIRYAETDYLYCVLDIDTDYWLTPKIAVGRLPVRNESELNIILDKTISYKPVMSKKTFFAVTENWTDFINGINNSIKSVYYNMDTYIAFPQTNDELFNYINNENDYIIFIAHGSKTSMLISSGINSEIVINYCKFYNSTIIISISCSTGYYSDDPTTTINQAFLFDPDSKTTVFIGSVIPTTGPGSMFAFFFSSLPTMRTVVS